MQFTLQSLAIEATAQTGGDGLQIPLAVPQAAGAPRRRGDVEDQARYRRDTHLAEHQPLLLLVDQLGPHPAVALGEAQILELEAGHDLASILQEQPPPQPGNLEQQIAQDVAADVGHPEQLPEHRQHGAIEAQHLQELPEGGGHVALQPRQQQGGGTEAGLARGPDVRIAVQGGEGQPVVLHRVHLAPQQIRGEVEAAGHRQTRILQTEAHRLSHQQAVGPGIHHHLARPQPLERFLSGPVRARARGTQLHHETVAVGQDPPHRGAQAQIQPPLRSRQLSAGPGQEGFREGLVVDSGGGVADADRHDLLGPGLTTDLRHLGFPLGDRGRVEQLHRREMGGELLIAAAQEGTFLRPHSQHHLRGAEHAQVALGRLQQFGVATDHLGGALHLQRLLKGVVGLDVTAMDRLAVVGGLGVHLRQLPVALHQGE